MPKYFHALSKKCSFYEAWYFKHVCGNKSIAIVPGIHFDHLGHRFAFIEIIADNSSYYIPYPFSAFNANKNHLDVQIDVNHFSHRGIKICIDTPAICLKGAIHYEHLNPPSYFYSPPFPLSAFTSCHTTIISITHTLSGYLTFNKETIDFTHGTGYIELNWGRLLPKTYLWTQCNTFNTDKTCCITASIFPSTFLGKPFINTASIIYYDDTVYTLATHLGAKIIECSAQRLIIRQGPYSLSVKLLHKPSSSLIPPLKGDMCRTIHNCSNHVVSYHFAIHNIKVFDLVSTQANFEFFS